MSEPKPPPARSRSARFPCANCQAEQTFDAVHGMLRCDYCGTTREVPPGPTPPHPGEQQLDEGLRRAAQPIPVNPATQTLRCKECGAAVVVGRDQLGGACAFCGYPSVDPEPLPRRALQPDWVLPFSIEKRAAERAFARWLRELWLRPSDLHHLAALDSLHGVYVPFWIFGAHVESLWSAESGRYYYVADDRPGILARGAGSAGATTPDDDDADADASANDPFSVQGGPDLPRPARVRKTRWRMVSGRRSDVHRDVLVCASQGLQGELPERLRTFDLRRLVPYAEGYLAGFAAEAYALDLGDGHARARQHLDALQLESCSRDVTGDTHRNLVVRNRYSNETFRYALLPVWIATYRYRSRLYRFVVSGQTGEVIGHAPYSHLKVALVCLLALTTLLLTLYLYQRPVPSPTARLF